MCDQQHDGVSNGKILSNLLRKIFEDGVVICDRNTPMDSARATANIHNETK